MFNKVCFFFNFHGADIWVLSLGWWLKGACPLGLWREGPVSSKCPDSGRRREAGLGGSLRGGGGVAGVPKIEHHRNASPTGTTLSFFKFPTLQVPQERVAAQLAILSSFPPPGAPGAGRRLHAHRPPRAQEAPAQSAGIHPSWPKG